MISDAERREVARRLRGQAKMLGPNMDAHEFANYTADVIDVGECMTWYEMTLRLADLIEPEPERTCQVVSAFETDELEDAHDGIAFSPEDTLSYMCKSCGFDFRYERGLYPKNYCPNCGAKVVNDD